MTLRTEIHSAFDEVRPQPFGLSDRILGTVAAATGDRRSSSWFRGMREPISAVAVFVLIALVVGALVGGKVWYDWNASSKRSSPAGGINQADLAALEARPLNLPAIKGGAPCPEGPITNADWYGAGPVYALGPGASQTTKSGTYSGAMAAVDGGVAGLILIRGRDLSTKQAVLFSGPNAAGPLAGTDVVGAKRVQLHTEAVFDTSHPPAARWLPAR